MRVLVTGGAGFIGSYLVHALRGYGHEVVTISRRPAHAEGVVRHYVWDVVDAVPDMIGDVDAIVHLAGLADASSSFADPVVYSRVNALGALHLLEAARRSNATFVLASSQRVYRPQCAPLVEDAPAEPVDPYGYSKLVAEQWTRMYRDLYGLRATVLRFFSVYGPGQVITGGASGVVSIFANRALRGEPLRIASRSLRDFTCVSDVVRGIMLALENPAAAGETLNIATGAGTSIAELAEMIRDATQSSSQIHVDGDDSRNSYVADITRARDVLAYEPLVGLRQGIQEYVAYLTSQSSAEGPADAGAAPRPGLRADPGWA